MLARICLTALPPSRLGWLGLFCLLPVRISISGWKLCSSACPARLYFSCWMGWHLLTPVSCASFFYRLHCVPPWIKVALRSSFTFNAGLPSRLSLAPTSPPKTKGGSVRCAASPPLRTNNYFALRALSSNATGGHQRKPEMQNQTGLLGGLRSRSASPRGIGCLPSQPAPRLQHYVRADFDDSAVSCRLAAPAQPTAITAPHSKAINRTGILLIYQTIQRPK